MIEIEDTDIIEQQQESNFIAQGAFAKQWMFCNSPKCVQYPWNVGWKRKWSGGGMPCWSRTWLAGHLLQKQGKSMWCPQGTQTPISPCPHGQSSWLMEVQQNLDSTTLASHILEGAKYVATFCFRSHFFLLMAMRCCFQFQLVPILGPLCSHLSYLLLPLVEMLLCIGPEFPSHSWLMSSSVCT